MVEALFSFLVKGMGRFQIPCYSYYHNNGGGRQLVIQSALLKLVDWFKGYVPICSLNLIPIKSIISSCVNMVIFQHDGLRNHPKKQYVLL